MSNGAVKGRKRSLKCEYSTVLLIFICFMIAIVVVQLIMNGGSEYPNFVSVSNLLNIMMQVTCVGIKPLCENDLLLVTT